MGQLKIIIGAIDDKIDKLGSELNHDEYDGYSTYYHNLRDHAPHIIDGIIFVVTLLHETKSLTDEQVRYFAEKINELKY